MNNKILANYATECWVKKKKKQLQMAIYFANLFYKNKIIC